jgi:uncharacterized lipoprotein YajG
MRFTSELVIAAALLLAGCDNTIDVTEVLPPLDAASVDADAGG